MYDAEFQFIPNYLSNRLSTMGLIHIDDSKTKFSQIRVYIRFGADNVGDLIPWGILYGLNFHKILGYWFYKAPGKLGNICVPEFVNALLIAYQKFIYRQVYKHTVNKFPKYKHNILSGADYPELLRNL